MSMGHGGGGDEQWVDGKEWSVGDWEFDDDDDGVLNQLKRNWRVGLEAHYDAIDGDNDAVKHPGDPPMTPIDQNLRDPDGDSCSREPMDVESTKVEEVEEIEAMHLTFTD